MCEHHASNAKFRKNFAESFTASAFLWNRNALFVLESSRRKKHAKSNQKVFVTILLNVICVSFLANSK